MVYHRFERFTVFKPPALPEVMIKIYIGIMHFFYAKTVALESR